MTDEKMKDDSLIHPYRVKQKQIIKLVLAIRDKYTISYISHLLILLTI